MNVMKLKKRVPGILIFLAQLILSATFLYPFFFMLINSLKSSTEYYINPFSLPLGTLHFENYVTMISQFKILDLFKNTLFVGVAATFFIIALAVFASYAFAKLPFRGKNKVYILVIVTMFIPAQVTMIPMYLMYSKMGLTNNYLSVVLSYLAMFLPEAILLMTSNFKSIPNELMEAAEIDGCNYFQVIRNVVVPMGKPSIVLCVIFYFILIWNDLFTPMVLITKMEMRTVMVALATLMARYTGDPPYQFAGLVMSAIPAILVYILFQKNIIKGMSVGAIK